MKTKLEKLAMLLCQKIGSNVIETCLECSPILIDSCDEDMIYILDRIEMVDGELLLLGSSCYDDVTLTCSEVPDARLNEIYDWLVDNEEYIIEYNNENI